LFVEVEHNLTCCHGRINLREFVRDIIGWNRNLKVY
jgi:hypothetical protein